MAKQGKSVASKSKSIVETPPSRSLKLAEKGPKSLMDIADFTLAVACDVIRGAITPNSANATASNVAKSLKSIEMQLKYGSKGSGNTMLAPPGK